MGEGQGERLADEAATRNQDIAAQGIGHGFALEHFSASRKGKDPPCGEAMGRWQREALTEGPVAHRRCPSTIRFRSEEHTSELQSLMRISYAVFCLKKKNIHTTNT